MGNFYGQQARAYLFYIFKLIIHFTKLVSVEAVKNNACVSVNDREEKYVEQSPSFLSLNLNYPCTNFFVVTF